MLIRSNLLCFLSCVCTTYCMEIIRAGTACSGQLRGKKKAVTLVISGVNSVAYMQRKLLCL